MQKCKRSTVSLKTCARCAEASYCSKACQREDWPKHKERCKKVSSKVSVRKTLDAVSGEGQHTESLKSFFLALPGTAEANRKLKVLFLTLLGTAEADIKVPSVHNTQISNSKVPTLKA